MDSAKTGKVSSRTPAYERILEAASELFYREGIRAVGVDAVAEAAGVTKKTLYEKFGSKNELVAAYLRARDARWRRWLQDFVQACGDSPKERLLATFDGLGEWMERENPRGCGFVNAYAELADPAHPAREVVLEQKRWLLGYLVELSAEAGAEDARELAETLLVLHEGATVTNSLGVAAGTAARSKQAAAALTANLER